MRRYSLTSLLGIAAEEDDDANVADGNTVNAVQDRKPVAPKADVMVVPENKPMMYDAAFPLMVPEDAEGKEDWVGFGKHLIGAVKKLNFKSKLKAGILPIKPHLMRCKRMHRAFTPISLPRSPKSSTI